MSKPLIALVLALPVSILAQQPSQAPEPRTLISEGLPRPSDLRAMPCGTHVDLRWDDNASEEASFAVLRRELGARHDTELGTVTEPRFQDTTVVLGLTYEYRVVARDAAGRDSRPSRPFVVTANANPPVITSTLAQGTRLTLGEEREFEVSVSDPDGDLVSLRLLNPPPGLVFLATEFEPAPVTRELRWRLPASVVGRYRLVFQAGCADGPRATIDVSIEGTYSFLGRTASSFPITGDVTGDGIADVVIAVCYTDEGATDAGAVYVWDGSDVPDGAPSAVLVIPLAAAHPVYSCLSAFGGQAVQLADFDGDGVLDILAAANRTLYAWSGGSALGGTVAPTATLTAPLPGANDYLGNWGGQGGQLVQLADVTGDGRLDVVAASVTADIGGVNDAGALFVWDGASLSGTVAPTAILSEPGQFSEDGLGSFEMQGFHLDDVTGDGVLDIVAGNRLYRRVDPAFLGVGAVFVWRGGSTLTGAPPPLASLMMPDATGTSDRLGDMDDVTTDTLQLADVTNDGVLDVVVGAMYDPADGHTHVPAIYIWKGGPLLSGWAAPLAKLSDADTHVGARLGMLLEDVDSDGFLDFLGAGYHSALDSFVIQFWRGGALAGTVAPDATLVPTGGYVGFGYLRYGDVTGDGVEDIVAADPLSGDSSAPFSGRVYVWETSSLAGLAPPLATLYVPGAHYNDRIGMGLELADLDGDGVLDVLAGGPFVDREVPDAGALYLWSGGSGLSGTVAPTAALTVPHARNDYLGWDTIEHSPIRYWIEDLTGDGALDILVPTPYAGTTDTGALYIWSGCEALAGNVAPTATLIASSATGEPTLGYSCGQGVWLADVDGDQQLDVVAGAAFADWDGVADTGAVFFWRGGRTLVGRLTEDAALIVPGASAGALLGSPGQHAAKTQFLWLADLTRDGLLDVLAYTPNAAVGGVASARAAYIWSGAAGLSGTVPPHATMAVDGASPGGFNP